MNSHDEPGSDPVDPDPENVEAVEERPDFSLVILCYRSEDGARNFVQQTITALEGAAIESYELILVGNYVEGATDRTPTVVAQLSRENPRIRCTTEVKQGWMGWDMRSGLRMARGDYIGVIDGDGQMPVTELPTLYQLIRSGGYGLVKTFRVTRGDSLLRKLISNVYNKIFHLIFPGLKVKDINSKPKIMTRAVYEKIDLESDGWFIDAEIMIEARRHGVAIGEIPTDFLGLTGRRSFVGMRAILEFLWNLARYRIREFWRKAHRP